MVSPKHRTQAPRLNGDDSDAQTAPPRSISPLTVVAIVPVAAMAATPIETVKADLTKLSTDVQTKHDTVVADAQKLQADATSFLGTSDKKAARAAIKADAQKLTTDWHSLLAVCLADRAQLHQDIAAAARSACRWPRPASPPRPAGESDDSCDQPRNACCGCTCSRSSRRAPRKLQGSRPAGPGRAAAARDSLTRVALGSARFAEPTPTRPPRALTE